MAGHTAGCLASRPTAFPFWSMRALVLACVRVAGVSALRKLKIASQPTPSPSSTALLIQRVFAPLGGVITGRLIVPSAYYPTGLKKINYLKGGGR